MSVSFDAVSIGLSFITAFSILIGFEIINTLIKQFRVNKKLNICLCSLIIWSILFEIVPFIFYSFVSNNNLAILIIGYPLSILFILILHCCRLHSKLNHSLTTGLTTLQLQTTTSLEKKISDAHIDITNDTKKNTIDIIIDTKKLTLKHGGMYWILCLNTKDDKPIGYMSCNQDGYCYNNCNEPKQSMFEIIAKDQSHNLTDNYVDIISYWNNVTDGTRLPKTICMKEEGYWSGYIGMFDKSNIMWKLLPTDTLAENGYKIQYYINGVMKGWLGYNNDNKWCRILQNEEDAPVYILGRHS